MIRFLGKTPIWTFFLTCILLVAQAALAQDAAPQPSSSGEGGSQFLKVLSTFGEWFLREWVAWSSSLAVLWVASFLTCQLLVGGKTPPLECPPIALLIGLALAYAVLLYQVLYRSTVLGQSDIPWVAGILLTIGVIIALLLARSLMRRRNRV